MVRYETAAMAQNKTRNLGDLFVGRKQELLLLQNALQESASGRPCVLAVVGEPGIGKTRMPSAQCALRRS